MIVSTLPTYPGKRVVKDLGIVFAYDDIPRLSRFAFQMDKCLNHAKDYLIEKAKEKGANAILGVSMSLAGENKPMLLGTAVVLEDE